MNQKGISSIVIILIIVGVLVIGGLFWYYQKTLQIISQPVPQVTPTDETANWQTYQNDEYGFELNYPKDWSVDEGCQKLGTLDSDSTRTCFRNSFGEPKSTDEVVLLILKKKYSSIDDYLNAQLEAAKKELGEGKVSFSKEKIDKGYKVTAKFPYSGDGSTASLTDIILMEQDQIFILRQVYPKECQLAQCEVLNQILSTFKFIK